MEVIDVVKKLVGKIKPIGDSSVDELRFENLKAMCALFESLFLEIETVARFKDRPQYSIKKAGEYANSFLLRMDIDF